MKKIFSLIMFAKKWFDDNLINEKIPGKEKRIAPGFLSQKKKKLRKNKDNRKKNRF